MTVQITLKLRCGKINHIKKAKTQWYVATDVNVPNYYGSNLKTLISSLKAENQRLIENLLQKFFKCTNRFIYILLK